MFAALTRGIPWNVVSGHIATRRIWLGNFLMALLKSKLEATLSLCIPGSKGEHRLTSTTMCVTHNGTKLQLSIVFLSLDRLSRDYIEALVG